MNYIYNEEKKQYEIEEYSKALENCKKFIKDNAHLDLVIQNEDDKKIIKNSRTEIRKKNNEIATLRKDLNEIVMGNFNEQAKQLEQELKDADEKLKSKLDTYENKLDKPKIITITIKSYDESKIKQIKDLAIKLNMEVK